jgi:hypothetical protein
MSGPDFVVVFDGTEQVGQLYASSEQVSGRGIRMYFDADDLEGILARSRALAALSRPNGPRSARRWDGTASSPIRAGSRSASTPAFPPNSTATSSNTWSPRCSPAPPLTPPTGGAGRCGGADNRPAPAPATTTGKPTDHEDHDLRLEY